MQKLYVTVSALEELALCLQHMGGRLSADQSACSCTEHSDLLAQNRLMGFPIKAAVRHRQDANISEVEILHS